jgi:hypothetical protein
MCQHFYLTCVEIRFFASCSNFVARINYSTLTRSICKKCNCKPKVLWQESGTCSPAILAFLGRFPARGRSIVAFLVGCEHLAIYLFAPKLTTASMYRTIQIEIYIRNYNFNFRISLWLLDIIVTFRSNWGKYFVPKKFIDSHFLL